tara:strand:- start:1597 stop:2274 length:678 start_codon:yes stop_codon:yes gene_type:complete
MARSGVLSDASIKRHCPEMFTLDFRTHQSIYEDSSDMPKHGLNGIKRGRTPHTHIKAKPRYPVHDLHLVAQATNAISPSINTSVGLYRRAIGDALEREGAPVAGPVDRVPAAFQVAQEVRPSMGREGYLRRFDEQFADVLGVISVDPRAKIMIELAGLNPYEFIPRSIRPMTPIRITAGSLRNELLSQQDTFTEQELRNIQQAYVLSGEIAHNSLSPRAPASLDE